MNIFKMKISSSQYAYFGNINLVADTSILILILCCVSGIIAMMV